MCTKIYYLYIKNTRTIKFHQSAIKLMKARKHTDFIRPLQLRVCVCVCVIHFGRLNISNSCNYL